MGESYVILGDGIAGSSAAETIREEAPDADITVVTDEGEALYNRILIKEYAKGKLPEAPISIHEESWYADRDIELSLNTLVTSVDPAAHEVHTHDGTTIEYDKLLVATGGTPAQLPVENTDADGIYHFWTFQDARAIQDHASRADRGAVIGAGLLGIDLAAVCAAQDVDANYLMRGECWWRYALTPNGAEIIHDALREKGVTPVFGSGVERFETDDDGALTGVVNGAGERFEAEFAGVAIGLDFNTEFLQDTDVTCSDGVHVDEHMRTGVSDVYAAGDITQFYDTIMDERAQNGSWGSAKQQGVVAAKNMVADEPVETFRWVSSYSITHFDFPFLSFGFPTMGDDDCERRYSDTEWRRLTFKDGKLIGGVLIGDLSPQGIYKRLIREEREVADQQDVLLEQEVDEETLAPAQEQAQ
ncbi:MAG: NAD(P)/FAD-dependent oxidoreductase [Halobacteriaceae archaeon]